MIILCSLTIDSFIRIELMLIKAVNTLKWDSNRTNVGYINSLVIYFLNFVPVTMFESQLKGIVIPDSYGYLFRQKILLNCKWIQPKAGLTISQYFDRFLGEERDWDNPSDPDEIRKYDVSMNVIIFYCSTYNECIICIICALLSPISILS